jgi:glucose-6-phosphate 1-epimerase
MSVEELQRKFGSIAGASVVNGNGGMPAVRISRDGMEGEVYLHGGHVTRWKPAGAEEVIFTSALAQWTEGKAIRGGVPICFPWFGPKANDASAPQHGFARTRTWKLERITEERGEITVEMSDSSDEATRRWWPFEYELRHRATFGTTLKMELEVRNTGSDEFSFEEAQHTYFRVGDVRNVRLEGLDDIQYLDKMDGGARKRQRGEIRIEGETDRVFVPSADDIVIVDAELQRRVTISKTNSEATVIWNPWIEKSKAFADFGDDEWQRMVCIESCNLREVAVRLAAGKTHVMTTELSLARL